MSTQDTQSDWLDEPWLTPQWLAKRWCCSVGWLANQRSAGEGPRYLKVSTRVRYRLSDIEAYERMHMIEPVA